MGVDTAGNKAFFSISSVSLHDIKEKFSNFSFLNDFEFSSETKRRKMTWKYPSTISLLGSNSGSKKNFADPITFIKIKSSPTRNDVHDVDLEATEHDNNQESENKPFSSFLSPPTGNNVSKSFHWALDATVIESCQNPFEYYCLPIYSSTEHQEATLDKRNKNGRDDDSQETLSSDAEQSDEEENEDKRLYVPFVLPQYCEYCGSPSIQNCQKFDPACQRPATFFPRAKPPFGWSTQPSRP